MAFDPGITPETRAATTVMATANRRMGPSRVNTSQNGSWVSTTTRAKMSMPTFAIPIPRAAPEEGEDGGFGQELTYDPRTAGSEGRPDRQLLGPAGRPGQQEIRHVTQATTSTSTTTANMDRRMDAVDRR